MIVRISTPSPVQTDVGEDVRLIHVTMGVQGPPGAQGERGPAGPAGADSTVPGPPGATGPAGADGAPGADGTDGREVELQTSATHVQWRYAGEGAWSDLIALSELEGPQGPAGADGVDGSDGSDGREVALRVTGTHVQWRLGTEAWQDLIALTELQGPAGSDGAPGVDGADGSDGAPGADGREVQLQTSASHIQWRLEGEAAWTDLVALADLQGPAGADGADGADGEEVGLQVTATHIQWRLGSGSWQNLVALSELRGPKGEDGSPGAPGADGADGVGVPAGGAAGQVLAKASGTDYDTEWVNQSGSGGGGDLRVVQHGSNASAARPTATVVLWRGSADPTNAAAGDLWDDSGAWD